MTKIIFQELSYRIVGCSYEVYNSIGKGRPEKYYQKGMASEMRAKGIRFREQVHFEEKHKGKNIGRTYFDFIVEDKIVVELKQGEHFSQAHFDQLVNYLKISHLKLGLLINFTATGVKVKRVLNLY